MVQVFEEVCHPDEHNEYRTTLDESVTALHTRTQELGTVPDIDRVSNEVKQHIGGMFAKDPAFCQRGHLFDIAGKMRDKSIEQMRQDISQTLAVPRERQGNGCI